MKKVTAIIFAAVSYTHLDVYKRQGVDFSGAHDGREDHPVCNGEDLGKILQKEGGAGVGCLLYTSRCV